MKKILLAGVIAACSAPAYAVPDTWSIGAARVSFTSAIPKAAEFEVYVNHKPAGKFKPRAKNSQKIFSYFECTPVE
ncbi:TPA: hypothetical protein QH084_002044 [Morganella morganii subsp. morganii]|nr:hypothetical protein [Morganella morganii subsp. morganii]